jgi:hypothetical protein
VTVSDSETPTAQVSGWLGEGYATWGGLVDGEWVEYQIVPAGAHPLAALLERHLPTAATR